MVLRLAQYSYPLKTCSKNASTINALLRVRYLRYINLHFANNQWLFDLQIHFRFERPYNATNTTNFLPNRALCLVQVEKYPPLTPPKEGNKRYSFLCSNTILLHFREVAARLRSVNISLLRAVEVANIFHQSFEAFHSHNKQEMALPNIFVSKKLHHANDNLLWLFLLLFSLILR